MDVLIYAPEDDEINVGAITEILSQNPLPKGYIYTLVSYLTPGQVRVQAMWGGIDTGERISETADTLQLAIDALSNRISQRKSNDQT